MEQETESVNKEFNTFVQNIRVFISENVEGNKLEGAVLLGEGASFADRGGVIDQTAIDARTQTAVGIDVKEQTTVGKTK